MVGFNNLQLLFGKKLVIRYLGSNLYLGVYVYEFLIIRCLSKHKLSPLMEVDLWLSVFSVFACTSNF